MNMKPKTPAITAKIAIRGMKSISIVADAGSETFNPSSIAIALSVSPCAAVSCATSIVFEYTATKLGGAPELW